MSSSPLVQLELVGYTMEEIAAGHPYTLEQQPPQDEEEGHGTCGLGHHHLCKFSQPSVMWSFARPS